MNGYQRIEAALKGQQPDTIPVMLHNFMVAAHEAGYTMEQFRNSSKKIAEAFIRSVEKYGYDGILVDVDTVTLAGACGVPVDLPVNEPARSHRGCLDDLDQARKLKVPDLSAYPYAANWLEAVRLLKEHFGDEVYIRGNCDQSPFSLASMIRGTQNWMMDFYTGSEESVHELLRYAREVTVQFVNLMAQTGAHMISNGDSPAGSDMIHPDFYRTYALPYQKDVVRAAHDHKLPYVLHICGNTEPILEYMIESGADGLELDYKTDLHAAFERMHNRVCFIGNVDPSGVLALSAPEQVRQVTLDLLTVFSKTNRFILNAGCALPPDTPEENLKTFIQTARDFVI